MAAAKRIIIKESIVDLKSRLKKAIPFIVPRIRMLIEMKKEEATGISKRRLAEIIGVNHNSIQTWRTIYLQEGIEQLCSHKKVGFHPSVFTSDEHQVIEDKLKDPYNGMRGYKELLEWIEKDFNKEVKYNTLLKYCRRNFGSKIKVARKSHVNKDDQAVDAFKKTSYISVDKPLKVKKEGSQE